MTGEVVHTSDSKSRPNAPEPMMKERAVYESFSVSRVTWHRWKKLGIADPPDLCIGGCFNPRRSREGATTSRKTSAARPFFAFQSTPLP